MTEHKPDTLYADPLLTQERFAFDEKVVQAFPDMIKRSVPGYPTILNNIKLLASQYVTPNSNCYDLGCSLGASTLAIHSGIQVENTKIIAIDNSKAMVEKCKNTLSKNLSSENSNVDQKKFKPMVKIFYGDILDMALKNSSMCVLNFTLQFIALQHREDLLKKIYQALNPGGILVISEKISFINSQYNELMIQLHHEFKRNNGYSDMEIAKKREALEQVLIPETLEMHENRLSSIGFSPVDIWFQCFNFISLIAFKP